MQPITTVGERPTTQLGPALSFDERQTCRRAHEYLTRHNYGPEHPLPWANDLPVFTQCPGYRQGRCSSSGYHDACLFTEPAWSLGWARVRRWRRLPSGGICFAEDYEQHLAAERAWPIAKPWADLVAHSYGIASDARGTVLAERSISTTGADLQLAIAWCLALLGADESAIAPILATHAPAASDPDAEVELPASVIYAALSAAALHGVHLAEAEALLREVAL